MQIARRVELLAIPLEGGATACDGARASARATVGRGPARAGAHTIPRPQKKSSEARPVSGAAIPEFIALAKANPGAITMAFAGTGSPNHLAGEIFKAMAGVDLTHVPYRGAGPAVADLLGGQVQVMFTGLPPTIAHIRSGRLRALGVTTATRFEAVSELPPVQDFVPGYEARAR